MGKLRILLAITFDLVLLFVPHAMMNLFVTPVSQVLSFTKNPATTGFLFLIFILLIRGSISSIQRYFMARRHVYDANVKTVTRDVDSPAMRALLVSRNGLVKPKTYLAEIIIVQLGLVFIIYAVARDIDGSLFGQSYNHPLTWLSFLIGGGYWFYYKYAQKDVAHLNRWTTPAIMFFISSVANLSVQLYLLISVVIMAVVEYLPERNAFKQTVFAQDITDTPAEQPDTSIWRFLSFMSKDQARLFLKSITTTLSIYYLFEITVSLGGSIYSGTAIPQIAFIVAIIGLDFILPDRKYGWFR